jgi:pyruvate/2-oxoglutarate/acetoin dehydrogenase E1 component
VQAEIVRQGSDVTLVGWGAQMRVLEQVRRRRLAV